MGIAIKWQDFGQKTIELLDDGGLRWVLKSSDISESCCLKFINPYGRTYFNYLQLPVLLKEVCEIRDKLTEQDLNKALLSSIDKYRDRDHLIREGAEGMAATITFSGVQAYLQHLIDLIAKAQGHVGTLLLFIGD